MLSLFIYFPVLFCLSVSVKWLAVKTAIDLTYTVSSGALNSNPTPTVPLLSVCEHYYLLTFQQKTVWNADKVTWIFICLTVLKYSRCFFLVVKYWPDTVFHSVYYLWNSLMGSVELSLDVFAKKFVIWSKNWMFIDWKPDSVYAECVSCHQRGHMGSKISWGCWLMQTVLYNDCKTVVSTCSSYIETWVTWCEGVAVVPRAAVMRIVCRWINRHQLSLTDTGDVYHLMK